MGPIGPMDGRVRYFRWRMRARMRRFLRPTFRRPVPRRAPISESPSSRASYWSEYLRTSPTRDKARYFNSIRRNTSLDRFGIIPRIGD